jgi:hypothetical protein
VDVESILGRFAGSVERGATKAGRREDSGLNQNLPFLHLI